MKLPASYDPQNQNINKGFRRGKVAIDVALPADTSLGGVTWYNSYDTGSDLILVQDSNTLGFSPTASATPVFFATSRDSESFLRTVNGLPGSPRNFTNTGSALNYLGANNYFIIDPNNPLPNIATSESILYVDGKQLSSYVSTGSGAYSMQEESFINTINPASVGANRYNNPGFAGGIFTEPWTYLGSPVWRTDFIAQSASFIPRLASTEGFGFYHAFGTFLTASNYYIASVYVSSSYPLQSSSTEGFNNTYSNISGWGINNTSTTRVSVGGGWTRLYTLWFQNVNGYATRASYPSVNYTINTTGSTTLIVSRSMSSVGMSDWNTTQYFVDMTTVINNNGGIGATILNHGLNTGSWTKLSYPTTAISASNVPFDYYVQLSVGSSGGSNVTVNVGYYPTTYNTAVNDNKFWKVTFNTSSLQVNQTASVFWAAPMIEPAYANFPSPYVLRSGSIISNGALTNGTTWNPNGWFEFDGVDDYINISNDTNLTNPLTVCALVNTNVVTSSAQVIYGPDANGQDNWLSITNARAVLLTTQTSDVNNASITGTTPISASRWYHIVGIVNNTTASLWVNGRNDANLSARSYIIGSWNSAARIGQRATGQFSFNGKISQVIAYRKELTSNEILQNYYQAPITTNGLVLAVDAGNLVSYESGSTTTYSLTGSLSGSLVNGVGYSQNNGGNWVFDGVDDFISGSDVPFRFANTFTLDVAVYFNGANIEGFIIGKRNGSPFNQYSISISSGNPYTGGVGKVATFFGRADGGGPDILLNYTLPSAGIYNIVASINANSQTLYVNGIARATSSINISSNTFNISGRDLLIGAARDNAGTGIIGPFPGNIYTTKIYNRTLTAEEVAQNFNAQRSRFGI